MANDIDPIVENWYFHNDKGQRFVVVAVDEEANLIEIQHFDGDIEEMSFDEWSELDIELSEPPENWSGALEISESDDYGTEITDTTRKDWNEPLEEIHDADRERLYPGDDEEP